MFLPPLPHSTSFLLPLLLSSYEFGGTTPAIGTSIALNLCPRPVHEEILPILLASVGEGALAAGRRFGLSSVLPQLPSASKLTTSLHLDISGIATYVEYGR